MSESLEGKVAIITGAGRGIGKAIALAYSKNGAKIGCLAKTFPEIQGTAEEIRNGGGEAVALSCDVRNYEELVEAIHNITEQFGRLDIVVINSGIDISHLSVEESNVEEWQDVIQVNLMGAYYTAKAAIPYLKINGGKIITIGSGLGHKGRADSSSYCTSKAGLWMFTKVLSQELKNYNISVNELIPGPVMTTMGNNSKTDGSSAFSIEGEWIKEPEDVTELAVFMAKQPLFGPTGQSYSLMRRDI